MNTVTATANTILIVIAFAAAGLVVLYAVVLFGRFSKHTDAEASRLHQERFDDRPCSRCSQPTGWSWCNRPLCPTCRKREIGEAA